jgi:MFS transporter, ACS family, hexuronate transporter
MSSTPIPAPDTEHPLTRYRWVICALLFLATTVNYVDRQILALVKPILDEKLKWSNEDYGNVNSAFQGAYACGLLFFGWFVDKFGTKIGYAVSIAAWSTAAIAHAAVSTVGGFFGARVGLGLSEGGNFPSAIKAVAMWFPKRERALATSIFNAGTNIGAVIAPAVVPLIALKWGWQASFVMAGIAGFLWLFLWIPFYDTPEQSKRTSPGELAIIRSDPADQLQTRKPTWISLLSYRQTWSFVIAKFLTDPVWWFFLVWLPDYFNKTRGLALTKSALPLIIIYSMATVISIYGGHLPGVLIKKGWSVTRARKTAMFVFALLVLPIVFVSSASVWPAVILIGLACSAHQAWSANLFTTTSDMFPKFAVASVVGLGGFAGSIGGVLLPKFAGRILDRFEAHNNATGGYAVLFGICAAAYLVAFAINHLCAPKFDPVQMKA